MTTHHITRRNNIGTILTNPDTKPGNIIRLVKGPITQRYIVIPGENYSFINEVNSRQPIPQLPDESYINKTSHNESNNESHNRSRKGLIKNIKNTRLFSLRGINKILKPQILNIRNTTSYLNKYLPKNPYTKKYRKLTKIKKYKGAKGTRRARKN